MAGRLKKIPAELRGNIESLVPAGNQSASYQLIISTELFIKHPPWRPSSHHPLLMCVCVCVCVFGVCICGWICVVLSLFSIPVNTDIRRTQTADRSQRPTEKRYLSQSSMWRGQSHCGRQTGAQAKATGQAHVRAHLQPSGWPIATQTSSRGILKCSQWEIRNGLVRCNLARWGPDLQRSSAFVNIVSDPAKQW